MFVKLCCLKDNLLKCSTCGGSNSNANAQSFSLNIGGGGIGVPGIGFGGGGASQSQAQVNVIENFCRAFRKVIRNMSFLLFMSTIAYKVAYKIWASEWGKVMKLKRRNNFAFMLQIKTDFCVQKLKRQNEQVGNFWNNFFLFQTQAGSVGGGFGGGGFGGSQSQAQAQSQSINFNGGQIYRKKRSNLLY